MIFQLYFQLYIQLLFNWYSTDIQLASSKPEAFAPCVHRADGVRFRAHLLRRPPARPRNQEKTKKNYWFLYGSGDLRIAPPIAPAFRTPAAAAHGSTGRARRSMELGAEIQNCVFSVASDPPSPFCQHPAPVKCAERSLSDSFRVSDWRPRSWAVLRGVSLTYVLRGGRIS